MKPRWDRGDLHIHSTASNAKLTPEEIIRKAKKEKLKLVSITDHDTVDGLEAAQREAEKERIKFIPGIEISAREIDILGYNIDYKNPTLVHFLEKVKRISKKKIKWKIMALRNEGYKISIRKLNQVVGAKKYNNDTIVSFFKKQGYTEFQKDYIGLKILKNLFSFYDKAKLAQEPSPKEAIEVIKQAGGVAVWAHPMKEIKEKEIVKVLLKRLKIYGIGGIEVYHPVHHKKEEKFLLKLAKKNGLIITAGSDFH